MRVEVEEEDSCFTNERLSDFTKGQTLAEPGYKNLINLNISFNEVYSSRCRYVKWLTVGWSIYQTDIQMDTS